jgi:hypothetical protein
VADGSAILEVKSTTKEFLAPRMTLAQRDASPVPGLQIWCTDCGLTGAMYFTQEVSGLLELLQSRTAIRDNTKKSSNHTRAGSYR